jgi:hypothetical protein
VSQSISASEPSRDGSPPRSNLVQVSAGDAIASVTVALIGFALLNSKAFLEWFNAWGNNDLTERDLIEDLTQVRETLKDMGYVWP